MADQVSISGPVETVQGSKEFVAWELTEKIAAYEDTKPKDRTYWLTLYRQCWKATNGGPLKNILTQD
jgi:hypothetical protein